MQENKAAIDKYIEEELRRGCIIGPFEKNPFSKEARFSPIDTRPKKDSDDLRIILNLSYPYKGDSVNNSINKDTYGNKSMNLKYPTVDDLAKIIRKKGQKARIFKRDLSKAYRQLFMSPSSIHYLGFTHNGFIYFDVVLSMGSSSAAYCCQRMTDCITYIYKNHGYDNVNYLDDLGVAENEEIAEEAYDCLGWILSTIGIKESVSKACPPAYVMIFLGILFNSLTMTMELTPERLDEIRAILQIWSNKNYATLKELQQLLGKLNFAASTVRAGRIFVSRIINLLAKFPDKGHRKLTPDMKKDIQWWSEFMEEFDRISIMPPINWD